MVPKILENPAMPQADARACSPVVWAPMIHKDTGGKGESRRVTLPNSKMTKTGGSRDKAVQPSAPDPCRCEPQ